MGRDTVLVLVLVAFAAAAAAGVFWWRSGDDEDAIPAGPAISEPADASESTTKSSVRRSETPTAVPTPSTARPPQAPSIVDAAPAGASEEFPAGLIGEITDYSGRPVAEAAVTLCEDVSDVVAQTLQGRIIAHAATDAAGKFQIRGFDPEFRYLVRVDHQDFCSKTVGQKEFARGEKREIKVQLSQGLSLTGSVVDTAGAPIAGAEVDVYDQAARSLDPDDSVERRVACDAQGNFEARNINAGFKRVVAHATGFASSTNPSVFLVESKPAPPLSFKLEPGSSIGGRCIDAEGVGIDGVLISAEPIRRSGAMAQTNYPSVKSKPDGAFVYDGLANGLYTLTFHKKGYLANGVRKNAQTGDTNVEVKMEKNPVFRGRVVDGETGQPVERFTLEVGRGEFQVFSSSRLQQRFDDPEGDFEYASDTNTGEVYLFAQASGYAGGRSEKFNVVPQQNVEGVVIKMGKGATVSGRVASSAGLGIPGANVELIPQAGAPNPFIDLIQGSMRTAKKTARTDAEGNYSIAGVQEGDFRVRASHPSFANAETENTFKVGRLGDVVAPTLSMMGGGTLQGIVYSKERKPEANTKVQMVESGKFGGGGYTATTDASGRFVIKNVRPGLYRVTLIERAGEPNNDIFGQLLMGQNRKEYLIADGEVMNVELD
jgi:protocatechuate 3,4-dioxygenase beta subunit